MTKVLVVATSRKTRGGITSVVKAHETGEQWKKFHCRWIETHRDKGVVYKLWYFLCGFVEFFLLIPFYDIAHIHLSEPSSAIRKLPFVFLARLWCKKVIVHFHAFSPETTFKSKYRCVYRFLFSHADRLIVLSPTWKRSVQEVFPELTNVVVVYNPCTTEPRPQKYESKKQILFAGTLNQRKGYADMIRAFALIAKDFPDWSIAFAGNGEVEGGKALAAELGILAQTVFLGWVNGEMKDKVFKESSIFCLPSYAEGFPMAVLDAWAYGIPVVTTPVGGMPDIAEDGRNVLLFPVGDIKAMARCFRKLIEEEALRTEVAQQSLKLAVNVFNVKRINKQVADLYVDVRKS